MTNVAGTPSKVKLDIWRNDTRVWQENIPAERLGTRMSWSGSGLKSSMAFHIARNGGGLWVEEWAKIRAKDAVTLDPLFEGYITSVRYGIDGAMWTWDVTTVDQSVDLERGPQQITTRFTIPPYATDKVALAGGLITMPTWQATHAYLLGDVVQGVGVHYNGHWYECKVEGSSGGVEPTWPAGSGAEVADGGVIWKEMGLCSFPGLFPTYLPAFNLTGVNAVILSLPRIDLENCTVREACDAIRSYAGSTQKVMYYTNVDNTGAACFYWFDEAIIPVLSVELDNTVPEDATHAHFRLREWVRDGQRLTLHQDVIGSDGAAGSAENAAGILHYDKTITAKAVVDTALTTIAECDQRAEAYIAANGVARETVVVETFAQISPYLLRAPRKIKFHYPLLGFTHVEYAIVGSELSFANGGVAQYTLTLGSSFIEYGDGQLPGFQGGRQFLMTTPPATPSFDAPTWVLSNAYNEHTGLTDLHVQWLSGRELDLWRFEARIFWGGACHGSQMVYYPQQDAYFEAAKAVSAHVEVTAWNKWGRQCHPEWAQSPTVLTADQTVIEPPATFYLYASGVVPGARVGWAEFRFTAPAGYSDHDMYEAAYWVSGDPQGGRRYVPPIKGDHTSVLIESIPLETAWDFSIRTRNRLGQVGPWFTPYRTVTIDGAPPQAEWDQYPPDIPLGGWKVSAKDAAFTTLDLTTADVYKGRQSMRMAGSNISGMLVVSCKVLGPVKSAAAGQVVGVWGAIKAAALSAGATTLSVIWVDTAGTSLREDIIWTGTPTAAWVEHRAQSTAAPAGTKGVRAALTYVLDIAQAGTVYWAEPVVELVRTTTDIAAGAVDGTRLAATVTLGTGQSIAGGGGKAVLSDTGLALGTLAGGTGDYLTFTDHSGNYMGKIATLDSVEGRAIQVIGDTPSGTHVSLSAPSVLLSGTDVEANASGTLTLRGAPIVIYGEEDLNGALDLAVKSYSADHTMDATETVLLVDATAAQRTITLPAANAASGRDYLVKRMNGIGSNVVVQRAGSDTIEGATSVTLSAQYAWVRLVSNGVSTWYKFGSG